MSTMLTYFQINRENIYHTKEKRILQIENNLRQDTRLGRSCKDCNVLLTKENICSVKRCTIQCQECVCKYYRQYSKWTREYSYDWLHLQLGSKCDWCGRSNVEVQLEIDHLIGALRCLTIKTKRTGVAQMLRDFEKGEPLRLLCFQCHEIRHAF